MDKSLDDIISAKRPSKGKGKGKGKGGGKSSFVKREVSQKSVKISDKKKPETSKVNTESLLNMSLDDVVSKLKVNKGGKGKGSGKGKGGKSKGGKGKGGGGGGGGQRKFFSVKGQARTFLSGQGKGFTQQRVQRVRLSSGMNRASGLVQNGRVKKILVKKTITKPGFASYPQAKGLNKTFGGRSQIMEKQAFRPGGKNVGRVAPGFQQRVTREWSVQQAQTRISPWGTPGFQRFSGQRQPAAQRVSAPIRQTVPFPGNQWAASAGKSTGKSGQRFTNSQVGRKGSGNVAGRRIVISNMPTNLQAAEIRDAFKVAGKVQEVEIHGSTAYVVFAQPQDAHEAEHQFDGGEINGQVIQVKVA